MNGAKPSAVTIDSLRPQTERFKFEMEIESVRSILERLQSDFRQDAEALATLQTIYAERVKQIRTNRTLPPDIQQRFLSEWERFYDQRVSEIFGNSKAAVSELSSAESEDPSSGFGIETVEKRPQKNS